MPISVNLLDWNDAQGTYMLRQLLLEYARGIHSAAGEEHIPMASYQLELANLADRYRLAIVARDGETMAGCVLVRSLPDMGEDACEMKRLSVTASYRGLGLGRRLAEHALAEARALGFRRMYLDTIPSQMPAAIWLYKTLGFQPVARYNSNNDERVRHFCLQL